MSIYRDSLAGLKSQVAVKRAVVATRDRDLSPVLRALLPAHLRDALAELRPRALADGDSMETLSVAEAALDAILALHDEAARLSPKLRDAPDEIPDPAPPAMSPPWLMEEGGLLGFRDAVRERVLRITTDTFLARFGDFAYIARFRIALAPYAVVFKARVLPDIAIISGYEVVLRTSVPEALPSLVLRPQRLHHVVATALYVARELELGDRELDERFFITGAEEATAVLTPAVRAGLVRLVDRAPVLRLGNGMATLSWSGPWRNDAQKCLPDTALDVLAGIRLAIETG